MHLATQKLLLTLLTLIAGVSWGWILTCEGYLMPVDRGIYFLRGRSGPKTGRMMPPFPMVAVTGKLESRNGCYT